MGSNQIGSFNTYVIIPWCYIGYNNINLTNKIQAIPFVLFIFKIMTLVSISYIMLKKIDLFDIDIIGCPFICLYILLAKVSFMGFPLYLVFNV